MVWINKNDLNAVRRAATNAHSALVLAARGIRKSEDQTTWKGPGRRQYDERSSKVLVTIDRFARKVEQAERALDRALIRVDDEMKHLGKDERKVRAAEAEPPALPRTGASQVLQRLRWGDTPPPGDTEWAVMARTLYGRSESDAW